MRCPKCQAEIPAGAPEGLCPQCLLQAALDPKTSDSEPKTKPYSPTSSGFVPPTPEALQAAFPQLEILELLGKGGMGAVYKARQPGLDRLVAVKILPPEVSQDPAFAERFTREARALAMLSHPNIVGIYDSGKAGGYYYFVMEYLDGVNLRQAMRAGELKSAEALKIVPQICEALQFAHDEGIVHRDIKPENILLDKKGRVKIADFGLAKLLGKTAPDLALTGTQQVMGTMHYMAPEQLEGSRDVDHRADIYSLGVTFYEMLTGELPIGRFAAPSKIVQIDVRLDEVVLRSLEKSPEQRYQQASEIKTEVETIASGDAANPASASSAARSPRYFHWVILPTIGLCIVFAAGATIVGIGNGYVLWDRDIPNLLGHLAWMTAFLHCVWLYRKYPGPVWNSLHALRSVGTSLYRKLGGLVWAHTRLAWTVLCAVLFVMLWTPYERNRASWSGYLDGAIWPYRESNDCAISLEPIYPRFKRIVIREKTEIALSGNPNAHKDARQPDVHRTSRLTYDIELQLYGGSSRHMIVDALDGMSWKADGRSGSILDATSLAEWLHADDKPGEPEEALKERRAALTLQARAIADIIQRASREQYLFTYGGTREFPGGNFVSGAGVRVSRLENAANHHGRGADFRNEVFKYVPGWNAAESVKVEPIVPILYVGVPLMLAVWGIGLWLLLRRRRGAAGS